MERRAGERSSGDVVRAGGVGGRWQTHGERNGERYAGGWCKAADRGAEVRRGMARAAWWRWRRAAGRSSRENRVVGGGAADVLKRCGVRRDGFSACTRAWRPARSCAGVGPWAAAAAARRRVRFPDMASSVGGFRRGRRGLGRSEGVREKRSIVAL